MTKKYTTEELMNDNIVDSDFISTIYAESAGGTDNEIAATVDTFLNIIEEEGRDKALKRSSAFLKKSNQFKKAKNQDLNSFERRVYDNISKIANERASLSASERLPYNRFENEKAFGAHPESKRAIKSETIGRQKYYQVPTTGLIQKKLQEKGYDPGPIDNVMGNKTRNAIKEFQKDKDLNPDGVAGKNTLKYLLSSLNPFSVKEASAAEEEQTLFTTEELMQASQAQEGERPSKAAVGTTFTTDQLMAPEDFTQDLTFKQKILTGPLFKFLDKTTATAKDMKKAFGEAAISSEVSQAKHLMLLGELTPEEVKPLHEAQQVVEQSEDAGSIRKTLVGLAGMMPETLISGLEGVKSGTLAGGAALLGGATAPGAPVMFGAGYTAGSYNHWYKQGSGDLYYDLWEQGVPDNIAKPTAHLAGAMYAALEFTQMNRVIPGGRNVVKRMAGESVKKVLTRITQKYGADVAANVVEEFGQEIIIEASKELAKDLAGDDVKLMESITKVLAKGGEAAKASIGPMAVLGLPSAGVSARGAVVSVSKEEKALKAEAAKEIIKLAMEEEVAKEKAEVVPEKAEVVPEVDETEAYEKRLEEMRPFSEQHPEYDIPLHPAEEGKAMAEALEKVNTERKYTPEEHQALQDIKPMLTGKGDPMLINMAKPEFLKGLNVSSGLAQQIFQKAIDGEVLNKKEQKFVDGLVDKMVTFNQNTSNDAVAIESELVRLRETFPEITDEEIKQLEEEVADEWEDEKYSEAVKRYLAKESGVKEITKPVEETKIEEVQVAEEITPEVSPVSEQEGIKGREEEGVRLRDVEEIGEKAEELKFNLKDFAKDINDAIGKSGEITPEITEKQKAARERIVKQHLPALVAEAKRLKMTLENYLKDFTDFTKDQIKYVVDIANRDLLTAKQMTIPEKKELTKTIEKANKYEGTILKKQPPTPLKSDNEHSGYFELPKETKIEATRRKFEDLNLRLKKINDQIQNISGDVTEELDLYMQKDQLSSITSDRLKNIREEKRKFVEQIVKDGLTTEEVDDYLHALHAKERNKKMNDYKADRGEAPIDGLSGMTDAKADEILKNAKPQVKKYAQWAKRMTNDTIKYQIQEGLLSQDHAEKITSAYKNYVPLYRDMEGDQSLGIGQGIDTKGKEVKGAKGSAERRATSPIANIFYQKERAVTRKLKNDIGNNIIKLTELYPDAKKIFKVEKQKYKPVFNEDGELQYMDPKFKVGDNVIGTKIDGKQYFITIKDPLTARALKNTGLAQTGSLNRTLRLALGVWSSMKTRWRPEFLITNFERDLGEALLNLGVEKGQLKEKGKGLRRDVVKGIFPSQKRIWQTIRGTKIDPVVKRFLELGGDTGHFYVQDVVTAEKSLKQIEKEVKGEGLEKLLKPGKAALQVIDDLNTMVELGVRFSTYEQLIKRGMSEKRAIQSAADLTVNFSRQGEFSPYLKALYGFINPAIQGSSKVIRSVATREGRHRYSRRVATGMAGLVALGFLNRMISSFIDDEGDEQIPQWAKNNKIIIADGRGNNITLWNLPYGYSAFFAAGSTLYELMRGRITSEEALKNVIGATVDSFSPLDFASGNWVTAVTPTLAKPLVEVKMNETWYGGKIYPEQPFTRTPKPDHETYFKRTDQTAIMVSEMMSNLTGGGKGKVGIIDVSPGTLQYLYHQYIDGPAEFAHASVTSVARGTKGEFDPDKTPFVRQVIRKGKAEQWSNSIMYDTLRVANKKEITDLEKNRFYDAVDTGVREGFIEQKTANKNTQEFIKAIYDIEGAITSRENAIKIIRMPKDERNRLLKTYSNNTVNTILKGGR